jgi:ABC-type methionine transport system ATPase subunit
MQTSVGAGETHAIVGVTGAGKSTVIKLLLLRLDEPDAGRLTVDGFPVGELSFASLRAAIGYVGQDTFLFDATVAENCRTRPRPQSAVGSRRGPCESITVQPQVGLRQGKSVKDPRLRIGQGAEQAGVRVSLTRDYEDIGSLPEPVRVSGGRRHDETALRRLAGTHADGPPA